MVIFEMLVARGGRLNAKNHGGDTPLHLGAAHGQRDIVQKVRQNICQFQLYALFHLSQDSCLHLEDS